VLQIKNATPFKAMLMLLPDATGVDTLFTVVKATFRIGETFGLADEQVPVTMADKYYGEPGTSSIRVPSDVCLEKPGTDVLLVGSAWSPDAKPAWQMDVSVAVGSVAKTVRVSGDRVWDSHAGGATVSWVAPFTRVPLAWERAYGGTDETEKGPVADRRNPVGTGFRAPKSSRPLVGLPVPNIEDPSAPISSPSQSPPPAGFAPVAPHWLPRASYAGTYDDVWTKTRAPYLPHDFDSRFFHVAPVGLAAPRLHGGEPVDLRGVTPNGRLQFVLPTIRVRADYRFDRGVETRFADLETVILEPDDSRLVMVWRASLACDKKGLKVREVETTFAPAA
jgi:hypothetical protein